MNAAHARAFEAVSEALNPDIVIPVIVPAVTFGSVITAIAIVLYFRYRTQRLRQELYVKYLERGEPIPPAFLAGKPQVRNGDLRRGLVLLGGGIGLSLALLFAHQADAAGFGLIPVMIGFAFLIVWKSERADAENPDRSRRSEANG